MLATFISDLDYSVAFSFEPEGLIYVAGKKIFVQEDNLILNYSRLEVSYKKLYKKTEASKTPVFVFNPIDNYLRAKQSEKTTFDINWIRREVLTEKTGAFLRSEIKRMQEDPMYYYWKYCLLTT